MKNKRISAIIAVVLAVALFMPISAMARANKVTSTSSTPSTNSQITTARATIAQLNAEVLNLKLQAKTLVQKIRSDISGTSNIASITGSQDYKDILALLKSLKGTLYTAESHNYVSALKIANKKKGTDLLTSLNNVITTLTQKKSDLATAITNLTSALTKADAIAALKPAATSALNAFKTQSAQKKQTIATNRSQILQSIADNKKIISTIITTTSTNKTLLKSDPTDVTAIQSSLKNISKTLCGIYDGSVAKDNCQFKTDVKNVNYTAALTDLDNIIAIQGTRISTLAATKTQLQALLNQLNNVITTLSSKAASGTASLNTLNANGQAIENTLNDISNDNNTVVIVPSIISNGQADTMANQLNCYLTTSTDDIKGLN
jgi:hypothetical protein